MPQHRHIIDVLKQNIKDIARPNMFEVEFNTGLNNFSTPAVLEVSQHLVKSVNIPPTTLSDISINRMGRKLIIPGGIEYTDLTINFHNDIEGITRKFINDWQKSYYETITKGNYKDLKSFISGTVTIYQLNGNHERVSKIVCSKAYPKTIGDFDLGHETEDSLLSFNSFFTFVYLQYSTKAPSFSDIVI